jgi:hypothetical protein
MARRGGIASSEIHEGDDVVVRATESAAVSTATDFDQVPALIEDVFAALGEVIPSLRSVSSAQDFHGDGALLNGKVDVVGTDGQLGRQDEALGRQQGSKLSLKVTGRSNAGLPLKGAPGEQVVRLNLSTSGGVSGFDVCRVAGSLPDSDPALLETTAQGVVADSEFLREAPCRLPVNVSTDDIFKVRYFHSATGHVYDLSTSEGAYFANGILVHNCVREFLPAPERQDQNVGVNS